MRDFQEQCQTEVRAVVCLSMLSLKQCIIKQLLVSVASLQKRIIFYPLVQARSSILRLKYVFCFSSARLGNKQYLAYHPASQSARAKNTIHLCAIYSGSSPPAKSPLAFWTWNPGLNSTSPCLIDISDPNCPLFQRKPLLCLLLPSPPLSKCCPTLSTYRVARNVGGSLIFFGAAILLLFCSLSLTSLLS